VIGENEKFGGVVGEGFDSENRFLKQGFGRNQFEKVFGFGFTAEGPEAFPTATGHDEEEERRGHRKSLCENLGGGKFEV
jgi:hypothetical protein